MAMTPMKKIWWLGNAIIIEDGVGHLQETCVAFDVSHRKWLVDSLAAFHKVPSAELRMPVADVPYDLPLVRDRETP